MDGGGGVQQGELSPPGKLYVLFSNVFAGLFLLAILISNLYMGVPC